MPIFLLKRYIFFKFVIDLLYTLRYYRSGIKYIRGEKVAFKDLRAQITALSDVELCALVCQGSDPAFEEITHRYKGLIRLIAKEYSYPGFDVGDFMQLGLLGLYNACRKYKPESGVSFKNFAATCIKRRYISLVRSLSSSKVIPSNAITTMDDVPIYSENTDPEALMDTKESNAEFLSLVRSRLSFMEQSVLRGYVNGMSYAQIAKATGIDTKAVDNALQRVRKKLIR